METGWPAASHTMTPPWLIFSRAAADWSSPLPMSSTSSAKAANQPAVSGASASRAIRAVPAGAGSGQTSSASRYSRWRR